MPSVWSSSESPISVRVVWVDGIRHAILSKDDPLFKAPKSSCQRPRSGSTVKDLKSHSLKYAPYKAAAAQSRSDGDLDSCLVRLNFVSDKSARGRDNKPRVRSRAAMHRHRSAPMCVSRSRKSTGCNFARDNYLKGESIERDANCEEEENCQEEENGEEIIVSSRSSDVESDKISYMETAKLRSLSERVLQWLDISGVNDDDSERDRNESRTKNREVETVGIVARRKQPIVKPEELSMKLIVPIHYLIIRETSEILRKIELQLGETNSDKSKDEKVKCNDSSAVKAEETNKAAEEEEDSKVAEANVCGGSCRSYWAPFKKPQLHIFMPSLKVTEVQRVSSQESLSVETIDSCDES